MGKITDSDVKVKVEADSGSRRSPRVAEGKKNSKRVIEASEEEEEEEEEGSGSEEEDEEESLKQETPVKKKKTAAVKKSKNKAEEKVNKQEKKQTATKKEKKEVKKPARKSTGPVVKIEAKELLGENDNNVEDDEEEAMQIGSKADFKTGQKYSTPAPGISILVQIIEHPLSTLLLFLLQGMGTECFTKRFSSRTHWFVDCQYLPFFPLVYRMLIISIFSE